MDRYIEHVLSFVDERSIKPFNVVLDAGSGVGGIVAPRLFDRLPCKTTRLCFDVDGTFPNHEANPLIEENRQDITAEVIRQKADIGIAWDGDADRCFFIDGTGEFIAGDFITALLAEAFLIKSPGQTIIYDVRASYAVKDIVASYQGKALMNRVGHAFIKRRMREENAVFGGEVTGHYYFRDNFYADNGFIPALMILDLMSKKGMSLRDLLKPLREKYFISGEINTKVASMDIAAKKIEELRTRYADGNPYDLDGVSAEYPDWHFNVRQSNTEPLLRLNLEGLDPGDHGKAPRRSDRDHQIVGADLVRRLLESISLSGSSSAVERELPKLDVAGSIPVSRSNLRPRAREGCGSYQQLAASGSGWQRPISPRWAQKCAHDVRPIDAPRRADRPATRCCSARIPSGSCARSSASPRARESPRARDCGQRCGGSHAGSFPDTRRRDRPRARSS